MNWFSKKPSEAQIVGSEAGKAAREQVLPQFALTEFMEAGEFTPPPDFFRDPYVVGFLQGFVATMADVGSARRRKIWTEKEKLELILAAAEAFVGPAGLRDFVAQPRRCKDTEDYKNAYFAANTLVKAIHASKGLPADNPMVTEATSLIEERRDRLAEMFPEPRNGELLAWAVQEISVGRHIQKTYLSE